MDFLAYKKNPNLIKTRLQVFLALLVTCTYSLYTKLYIVVFVGFFFPHNLVAGYFGQKCGLFKKYMYIIFVLKKGTVFKPNQKWLPIILVAMVTGFYSVRAYVTESKGYNSLLWTEKRFIQFRINSAHFFHHSRDSFF